MIKVNGPKGLRVREAIMKTMMSQQLKERLFPGKSMRWP
jgi:hypothetical protein